MYQYKINTAVNVVNRNALNEIGSWIYNENNELQPQKTW